MSGADLFEDGYPHGTVEGYKNGCRGGACPGEIEFGMSCKRANTLSHGDYRYKKLAAAGKTPREIAGILNGTIIEPAATPVPAAPTPAQPLAESANDRRSGPQASAPAGEPAEGPAPAERDAAGIREAMGHQTSKRQPPPIKHGTPGGYARGCRDDCPGDPVTGLTCRQNAVNRARENKRRRAESQQVHTDLATSPDAGETLHISNSAVVTPDIAHRSDLLDEARERAGLVDATEYDALNDQQNAERPEWADVAIAEDVERLRNLAARLEQELAHAEEERDQAVAEAASAKRAMVTAILRWDETNQVNAYLQLQLVKVSAERHVDALYIAAIRQSRDTLLAGKLRVASFRRRRNR